MLSGFDLTGVGCDHNGCGSGFFQGLARLDEFIFLEEIGGEDGNAESCETIGHNASSLACVQLRCSQERQGLSLYL